MKSSILFRCIIIVCASAAAMLSLTSCHTTEGLGEDVQHLGRGIERSAERAHP